MQACRSLYLSVPWRRLLHQLLLVGNAINGQKAAASGRPGASGRVAPAFKLSSLSKFADMKAKVRHGDIGHCAAGCEGCCAASGRPGASLRVAPAPKLSSLSKFADMKAKVRRLGVL